MAPRVWLVGVVVLVGVAIAAVALAEEKAAVVLGPTAAQPASHGSWIPSVEGETAELWAVGDADPPASADVADLIGDAGADRIIYLGDVYETGTAGDFERWARPWRGMLDRMAPTPGNHEWPLAREGYIPFWGDVTGEDPPNRYRFRAAGWQVLSINSQLKKSRRTKRWLRKRLRSGGNCRIAFWHRPRFDAGHHPGARGAVKAYWDLLEGRARIVLNGHDHNMQRFRRRDGIVEFISGAGGRHPHPVDGGDPRLAFSDDEHFGALRLTLSPERARWQFVAVGGDVLDSGSVRCRA